MDVMKTASVESSGVKASKAWRRPNICQHRVAWRPCEDGRFGVVWASKPPCRQFCWFGPQTLGHVRCGGMAVMEGIWFHHEACIESKQSCEGNVSIQRSDKKLDNFIPKGHLCYVLHVRVFWSFVRRPYIESGLVCKPSLWWRPLICA